MISVWAICRSAMAENMGEPPASDVVRLGAACADVVLVPVRFQGFGPQPLSQSSFKGGR